MEIIIRMENIFGRMEDFRMTGCACKENVKKAFRKLKMAQLTMDVYIYIDRYTFYYDSTDDLENGIVTINHQISDYSRDSWKEPIDKARKFAYELVED